MSANPPSPSADRARVEAVRATLLELEIEAKGFATFTRRDPTQHAHYSQRAAALREAATWAPPGDEGLRAALAQIRNALYVMSTRMEGKSVQDSYVEGYRLLFNYLDKTERALAAVSPLPQKEERDDR